MSDRKLREKHERIQTNATNLFEKEDDFNSALQKEEIAAIQADLNPFEMGAEEKKVFPQFASNGNCGAYLQIRNHILGLWQDNLDQFLSLKSAEKAIQEKFKCIVAPTFDFLRRYGYINTGVVRSPSMDEHSNQYFHHRRAKVVIVGAGMSGLAAARQLHHLGFEVVVVEGRKRVGGRVNTDWSLGGGVDLGASIVTGLEGNPLTILFEQLGTQLHALHGECPMFDIDGKQIDEEFDTLVEKKFNEILDMAKVESNNLSSSLGTAIDYLYKRETDKENLSESESKKRRRLFNWHIANLEYANAINLNKVSTKNWDQDDTFDWRGSHCLLRDGYQTIAEHVSKGLDVRFDSKVISIAHNRLGSDGRQKAIVTTQKESIECDVVLVTVSLGVLKSNTVVFDPPLPEWKKKSIDQLGFGLLNKAILLFDDVFWDDSLDYFGQVNGDEVLRGEFYLFWNLHRAMDKPVLVALMAGDSAYHSENLEKEVVVSKVMDVLRKQFGNIPQPVNSIVTRWGSDEFARGTYSYIGVEASGKDYDVLAAPIDENLFFAGEATTRTHPATAAGAYLSGLRVAGDIYGSICGKIRTDFDWEKLFKEWKLENERSPSKRKHQKKMRKRFEEERGKRFKQRGKIGNIRKAKFNAAYSWLFDSNYKIPKKSISTEVPSIPSASNGNTSQSSSNDKQQKRFSDILPTKRKLPISIAGSIIIPSVPKSTIPTTPTSTPTASATPTSPTKPNQPGFSSPIQSQSPSLREYKDSYRSPPPRTEYGRSNDYASPSSFSPSPNNHSYPSYQNNSQFNNSQFSYNANNANNANNGNNGNYNNGNYYNQTNYPQSYSQTQQSFSYNSSYPNQQNGYQQQQFNRPPLLPHYPNPISQYSNPSSTSKFSKEEKASISNVVVGCLSKELKLYSVSVEKEKFKHLARKLAHHCCEQNIGKFGRDGMIEEESRSLIIKVVIDDLKKRKESRKAPFH